MKLAGNNLFAPKAKGILTIKTLKTKTNFLNGVNLKTKMQKKPASAGF
jgi:hypothetical protein